MPTLYRQTLRAYAYLCLAIFGYSDAIAQCGSEIVSFAQKDVGTLERTRQNDHPLFDFYRANVDRSLNRWKAPYCGCAVYSWFLLSGHKPSIKAPATALSWQRKGGVRLGLNATQKNIALLTPGMVVLMKFSRYHVGVLKASYAGYVVTIEGNTSNARAVNFVAGRKDGVFEKIRPYSSTIGAYDWCKDAALINAQSYIEARSKIGQ